MREPRHPAEEDGDGYFASVSDLMVGILFVFLLMLTVFALNYREAEQDQLVQRSILEQQKLETERQRAEAERQRQEANRLRHEAEVEQQKNLMLRGVLHQALDRLEQDIQQREQARQSLLTTLDRQLRERGVQVVIDQRSGVLRLSGDLLFATGSAALSPDAQRTVRVLAEVLAQTLPCYSADPVPPGCAAGSVPVLETVMVEGHTDHRPIGTNARYRDNDQLSTERALAVFAELRRNQPGLDAVRNADGLQLLGEAGYGDRRPLPDAQGMTDDEFTKNRRIDIRFVLTSRTSEELKRLREQIEQAIGQP
jgi:flagellar motor protein MotB